MRVYLEPLSVKFGPQLNLSTAENASSNSPCDDSAA
jgi:hypothetical protein